MSDTTSSFKRKGARAAGVVRDAWLIIGLTIALVLLLESAYRAARFAKRAVTGDDAPARVGPPNPFDSTEWAAEFRRNHALEEEVRWAPYVYIRNPSFQARYINVDSLGHRVTPLPAVNSRRTVRVFFLGGSTTFGWYQRDANTIPAEAARRLQGLLGNRARIEATNFGAPGHTFTQEILELLLQLRAGARPDVVVFYDGINDVMATVQNGRAGFPQNESNRAEDFAHGRRRAAESGSGIANDLRVTGRSALAVVARLQFVQKVVRRRAKAPTPVPADSLALSLVRVFAENARLVEALAAKYGFVPIYVWQPALLSTRKRLTGYEQFLMGSGSFRDVHRAVPLGIGAAVSPIAGSRFIDATGLFDDDTADVFVDFFGHTYERANPRVVDTLMPQLGPAVLRAAARAP